MARKRWTKKSEITPALLSFREKRKWQINLRRYVIDESPGFEYAPYFGLDIKMIRHWFEMQFSRDLSWQTFAERWQFEHIVPVAYFDFSSETDLRLCWNFTNLRVEELEKNITRGNRLDLLGAKAYFAELYKSTGYRICGLMLEKLETIELTELASTKPQQDFLRQNREYIENIAGYSSFEFSLLNSGRDFSEVKKEVEFLRTKGQ